MATSRSNQTLRTIKAQCAYEGKSPSLNAVSTIFLMLLEKDEAEETWRLFYEIAAMPLQTTRLEYSCAASGEPCEKQANSGSCSHKRVEVPTFINLDKLDEYQFVRGKRIKDAVQHWWGNQMAVALGGRMQ